MEMVVGRSAYGGLKLVSRCWLPKPAAGWGLSPPQGFWLQGEAAANRKLWPCAWVFCLPGAGLFDQSSARTAPQVEALR